MTEEDKSYQWLRPATQVEILFSYAQEVGLLLTTYGLTLRTAQPLQEHQVSQALLHLYRKVPTLRLCFRQRGDTLWACQMASERLDFKVTEASDTMKLQEELTGYHFITSEGPLWCARLMPPNTASGRGVAGLEEAFPHTRCLVLVNHHGIADGTTNNRVINIFLQILDDVIAGKHIDDTEQMGEFVSGEETVMLMKELEVELTKDEEKLQHILAELEKKKESEKLIPRAFPQPQDPNYTTKIIPAELDKETTSRFFKKCKDEGVTVNSGLTTVIGSALIDLVRDAGLRQDTYSIIELHAVNMRRYWSGDVSRALGCHISGLENLVSLPAKWRENFWEHARSTHKTLLQSLREKEPLKYIVYFFIGAGDAPPETIFARRPSSESDYSMANIGNLDSLIPTDGEHVRLAHMVRSTQCWNEHMLHMIHTLRGHLMYNLCYASDFIPDEQAQKLVDNIMNNLRDVI